MTRQSTLQRNFISDDNCDNCAFEYKHLGLDGEGGMVLNTFS